MVYKGYINILLGLGSLVLGVSACELRQEPSSLPKTSEALSIKNDTLRGFYKAASSSEPNVVKLLLSDLDTSRGHQKDTLLSKFICHTIQDGDGGEILADQVLLARLFNKLTIANTAKLALIATDGKYQVSNLKPYIQAYYLDTNTNIDGYDVFLHQLVKDESLAIASLKAPITSCRQFNFWYLYVLYKRPLLGWDMTMICCRWIKNALSDV